VSALLAGTARLGQHSAAEPEDAAEAMLFGESPGSLKITVFDGECLDELNSFRHGLTRLNGRALDLGLSRLTTLVSIVRRVKPPETVTHLHKNFIAWNSFFENFVADRGLDLRREYWRILALTQDIAEQGGLAPRRLMPMWLSICSECGSDGLYPESYLRVALTGLRQLPLGVEFNSNENFVLHGLARWAANRNPSKKDFEREWRLLEGDFPRDPTFWQSRVESAIAAMEHEIGERTNQTIKTFSIADWWRVDTQLRDIDRRGPGGAIKPPPRESHEKILTGIASSIKNLGPQIKHLIDGHRRYADTSGDIFFVVRTACNIGMGLIRNASAKEARERGEVAVRLAETAFAYDSNNKHAWYLYRDALALAGRLKDAELVGWEAVRRFPEESKTRSQLATVLAERLQKPDQAAALLKENIALFPSDAFPRNQLAVVLADDLKQRSQARIVLELARDTGVFDDATISLILKLAQNKPLRGAREVVKGVLGYNTEQSLKLPAAESRRALFLTENNFISSVNARALLEALPPDPYVACVLFGISNVGPTEKNFTLAFQAAAREGSTRASLDTLGARARPIEKLLIEHAIAVIENRPPPPANDNTGGGFVARISNVIELFSMSIAPTPAQRLRLLRDISASFLSTALAA
jgi:tetratricopeptide (TPR) repeat protein